MMMMIMVMMIVMIFFFFFNICELRNRNSIRVLNNDDDDGVILFLMNRVLKGIWWDCLIVKKIR